MAIRYASSNIIAFKGKYKIFVTFASNYIHRDEGEPPRR